MTKRGSGYWSKYNFLLQPPPAEKNKTQGQKHKLTETNERMGGGHYMYKMTKYSKIFTHPPVNQDQKTMVVLCSIIIL